jgi:uncharacterized surface protein with fasciclin (FAS1) repeats
MAKFAGDWTPFDLKDTAQFFVSTLWNLRDLRHSVGPRETITQNNLTLFAPSIEAWAVLNLEDVTRLSTPEWIPHVRDLCGHMLVEGVLMEEDLKKRWYDNGKKGYNLTSLINETIPIDYDEQRGKVLVSGGDLYYPDIKGYEG